MSRGGWSQVGGCGTQRPRRKGGGNEWRKGDTSRRVEKGRDDENVAVATATGCAGRERGRWGSGRSRARRVSRRWDERRAQTRGWMGGGWDGEDGCSAARRVERVLLLAAAVMWGGQKENAASRMGVVKKEKRQATRGWGPQLRGGSARGKARPGFGRRFRDGLDDLQGEMVIFLMGCAPSPFALMESTER